MNDHHEYTNEAIRTLAYVKQLLAFCAEEASQIDKDIETDFLRSLDNINHTISLLVMKKDRRRQN